jgi:hypothetical protein
MRSQIAVDDVVAVQVGERREELGGDWAQLGLGERLIAADDPELIAAGQLGHDGEARVRLEDVQQPHVLGQSTRCRIETVRRWHRTVSSIWPILLMSLMATKRLVYLRRAVDVVG